MRPCEARRTRWSALAAAGLMVVAAAVATTVLVTRGGSSGTGAGYSTSATAFVLPRLSGAGKVSLASFRGEPAVVTVFSSSCQACVMELPLLAGAAQELHGQVAFIGVDSDDSGGGLAIARQEGIGSWPLARDVGGGDGSGLKESLGGSAGLPLTAFYGPQGKLLAVDAGQLSAAQLGSTLYQLFGVRVQL